MSDIPFVERLGDAFDAAVAAPRRSRRRLVVAAAVAAIALGVAAIAVARMLAGPDELAAQNVACYSSADLRSNVVVVASDGAPAAAACADALRRMGERVPPLVACANGPSVAVIPGDAPSACARAGLAPLPEGFAASQADVAQLAHAVLALEAERDCIPPDELAGGVKQLLAAQGWTGWTVAVRSAGPCGSVSTLDGDGTRRVDGALDPQDRVVFVFAGAARSTVTLLYGSHGLARALADESGARCYTLRGLSALVHARAESAGRSATVELAAPLPAGVGFADVREQRYRAGCAVITDVRAASDGRDVVAVIPRAR